MPPSISTSPSNAVATGGWCAQVSPPKVTSPSKYPHHYGGGSLWFFGADSALFLLPSSRLHFIFTVCPNRTCSRSYTCSQRGAGWLNTDPAVIGLNPFSSLRFKTVQVCKSERGEGPPATLSVQHWVFDELFPGPSPPGCLSVWVTRVGDSRVLLAAVSEGFSLVWRTSEVFKNRNAKHSYVRGKNRTAD